VKVGKKEGAPAVEKTAENSGTCYAPKFLE
jgi:hypothetical protein